MSFSVTRSLGLVSSCVTWILILGLGRSPDDDFDTTSRTVEFATGATTNGFDVLVLADTDPEVLHRYQLMLFDPASGASLGSSSVVAVTIETNDDLYGIVSLIQTNAGLAADTDGTFRVLNLNIVATRPLETLGAVAVDVQTPYIDDKSASDLVASNTASIVIREGLPSGVTELIVSTSAALSTSVLSGL